MRSFTPFGVFGIACALILVASSPVFAGIVVTADEFGNGTWGGASLLWSTGADPTNGVIGENVLIYQLPSGDYGIGDIVRTDPGQNNVISDIIRFCNVNGVGMMIFYSDGTNGIDSLADISAGAWALLISDRYPPDTEPDPGWIPSPPLTWISRTEVYHTRHERTYPGGWEVVFTPGFTLEQFLAEWPPGHGYDIEYHFVVPGDVNGDGHVDVVDLLYLVDAFGSVTGDPNYDARCDFNSDGGVDVVDLLILVGNFGT